MADSKMGPFWPSDYATGFFGWDGVGVDGSPAEGALEVSLLLERVSAPGTHRLVTGGTLWVDLVDGHPYGEKVHVNDAGRYVVEFPRTDDADVTPGDNWVVIVEHLKSGTGRTMWFKLTADHTLDDPAWPTDDPEALVTQRGVTFDRIWGVDFEADGPPPFAKPGQWVYFRDTRNIYPIVEV